MPSKPSPRVYGDKGRLRLTLRRHISEARELLDLAEGVRSRLERPGASRSLAAFVAEKRWCDSIERWRNKVGSNMERHLGAAVEQVLPVLTANWPPRTGKPRHERRIGWVESWLRDAVAELESLQDALGVSRGVASVAAPPGRFEELRASGLVDEQVIAGLAGEMVSPRTPKQLADAIGAAKDLTEATLRAALTRLSVPWSKRDDLPQLMRKWRDAVESTAPPDQSTSEMLDRAQASLGSLIAFLSEWRNEYGRGHGRPQYPPGLRARHARLAVDAAETAIRFIVTTMDDLAQLPP